MKKILLSVAVIAAVAAVVFGVTTAFFSDTETSTGNTFTAGAIDLTVDNESYVTGLNGQLMASPNTSWTLSDITGQLFFNFSDLKPGDIGEDTISLHVDSNDAYLCAAARVTANDDVTCTEPELTDDPSCTVPGLNTGELANAIQFAFWADDDDNVYEVGEVIFLHGPLDSVNGKITLADSGYNVWGTVGALPGGTTKYIGKAWCFGNITMTQLSQDITGPLVRPGSVTCSGVNVNNAAQSDKVMGDIQFYAVQARNNSTFTCANGYTPIYPTTRTLILEDKDAGWHVIQNNRQGTLTYNISGPAFVGTFQATGLAQTTNYSLIYYADKQTRFTNWGGNNPGALIGTFTTDGSGNIVSTAVNQNLGMDLPDPSDWNANANPNYCDNINGFDDYNTCVGAKIWLVPTSEYDSTGKKLNAWNPANYLFETDMINYNDTDN